jgi:hypothetical protein
MIFDSLKALALGIAVLDFTSGVSGLKIPRLPLKKWPIERAKSRYTALNGTVLDPVHFKQYNSKRVILRYGPYKAPPFSEDSGMKEFQDMDAEKPCMDCMLIGIQAGLEYPNGSYANSNTGMWLHHIVLYDFGRKDVACPDLPYRFFASGNERTPLDMTLDE